MKREFWMLTRAGMVQHYKTETHQGMLVATSEHIGRQLRSKFPRRRLSVAKVGTVPGETLSRLIATSRQHGANCAFIVDESLEMRRLDFA